MQAFIVGFCSAALFCFVLNVCLLKLLNYMQTCSHICLTPNGFLSIVYGCVHIGNICLTFCNSPVLYHWHGLVSLSDNSG